MDSKDTTTNKRHLFADFPQISTKEWKEKITKDLKGADYERRLVWRTMENFNVQPFYREEDLNNIQNLDRNPDEFPFTRGTKSNNNWLIRQDIIVDNIEKANAKALDVLNRGADSIGFVITEAFDQTQLNNLLNGIVLSAVEIVFMVHTNPTPFVKSIKELANKSGVNLSDIRGEIRFAPLSAMLISGVLPSEETYKLAASLIKESADMPNFKTLAILPFFYHNCGTTIVEELGIAIAEGVEIINTLTELGANATDIAANMKFSFATGSNYFMEIAKIRAARTIWAQILNSFGVAEEDCKMAIHTQSSSWNLTVYDPYVNMLRTTTEAMSASIGGADSHTVLPFDHAWKRSEEFSERISRNQQLLLKEESHFDKVVDPSAGSYYIETLTKNISEQAWKIFLQIEEKGGFISAVKDGMIQKMVHSTAQKRDLNIATRKEVFVGINQFPNFTEKAEENISTEILTGQNYISKNASVEVLKPYRGATAFEKMRLITDNYSKENKRPSVFMLTIGNLTMRKARAQFSSNYFACAGFEVKDNNGFATIGEGVKAAKEYGADIVVLCSSDVEYENYAPELLEKLNGEAITVIAGYPKAIIEQLKEKGLEHFIHVKTNILENLTHFQQLLNVN